MRTEENNSVSAGTAGASAEIRTEYQLTCSVEILYGPRTDDGRKGLNALRADVSLPSVLPEKYAEIGHDHFSQSPFQFTINSHHLSVIRAVWCSGNTLELCSEGARFRLRPG